MRYSEPAYFFRLSKWVPALVEHIKANENFIMPKARRNEVLSKLSQGVEDLCISRSVEKLPWGVHMPNDNSHVVYVWIDALSNYYTALGLPDAGDEHDGEFASYWPCDVHLIGKDILWFHAVYWPCVLMAMGVELPKCIFAHGWWTSEGMKMSKSLGNFISRETIAEICSQYSRDVYRYFLLRSVIFGSDGDFSHDGLKSRYNSELANDVGNLLSRTVNMINRYFDGTLPSAEPTTEAESQVIAAAGNLNASAEALMETCQFHNYLDKVLALASATNKYIDVTEPFKLAKDESNRDRLAAILQTCSEAVRIVLLYLSPFMPESTETGLRQLGYQDQADKTINELGKWGAAAPANKTLKAEPLYPRTQ